MKAATVLGLGIILLLVWKAEEAFDFVFGGGPRPPVPVDLPPGAPPGDPTTRPAENFLQELFKYSWVPSGAYYIHLDEYRTKLYLDQVFSRALSVPAGFTSVILPQVWRSDVNALMTLYKHWRENEANASSAYFVFEAGMGDYRSKLDLLVVYVRDGRILEGA